MQGKDDIIELNGVHAPRVPMKVLILQERKEEGEGPGRGKGRGKKGKHGLSVYQLYGYCYPHPQAWCMGTAGHVPRPMCYWWAWYY